MKFIIFIFLILGCVVWFSATSPIFKIDAPRIMESFNPRLGQPGSSNSGGETMGDVVKKKNEKFQEMFYPPLNRMDISSGFGMRRDPIANRREQKMQMHNGIDLRADIGTPVFATRSGVVVNGVEHREGHRVITHRFRRDQVGHHVIVRHEDGYHSYYFHLSRIEVKVGDVVNHQTLLGFSGNSGESTAPHLCFRISNGFNVDGSIRYVDPMYKLRHYLAEQSLNRRDGGVRR